MSIIEHILKPGENQVEINWKPSGENYNLF